MSIVRNSRTYAAIRQLYNRVLRPLLPYDLQMVNGVGVRRRKLLDRTLVESDFEAIPVTALQSQVQQGDHVVIIGGGYGVTACWAAYQTGPDGRVTVYEAFEDTARMVEETVALNGLSDRVRVLTEAVTADTDLPDCDVLEIDCEGCEIDVLPALDVEPRVLIVEHHAKRQSDGEYVFEP